MNEKMSGTPTSPFKIHLGIKSEAEGGIYRPNPEEEPGLTGPSNLSLPPLQLCERTRVVPLVFVLNPTWLTVHKMYAPLQKPYVKQFNACFV